MIWVLGPLGYSGLQVQEFGPDGLSFRAWDLGEKGLVRVRVEILGCKGNRVDEGLGL